MHLPTLPHHILQKVIQNRNNKHLLLFPHDVSIVQIRRLQEIHFVNRDLTALHFLFPFFFKSRHYHILLCFGCCFGDFCSFSYFFSGFPWLLGWVLGAVFRISAVSATFSRIFAGFWARFGCCFRSFRDYSSPSPSYCLCYQPMAIEHYANLVLLS